MRMPNKMMVLTLLLVSTIGLGACNTMEGAGRDIERAGESVQDAAD